MTHAPPGRVGLGELLPYLGVHLVLRDLRILVELQAEQVRLALADREGEVDGELERLDRRPRRAEHRLARRGCHQICSRGAGCARPKSVERVGSARERSPAARTS
jgi:hypothetical protein